MKKLSKKERDMYIERIIGDVKANYVNYEGFVLNCVKEVISKWSVKELLNYCDENNDLETIGRLLDEYKNEGKNEI